MTIKLLVLKSGEELISDITEMAVGEEDDQKIVGYFLQRPCIVRTKNPGVIEKVDNKNTTGFEVTLIPWIPLSDDNVIPIPSDWLVTMVNPVEKLKEMYTEDVLSYGKDDKGDASDEQSDIGLTD